MIQRRTFSPFSKRSTSAPRVSIMFSPCFSMKISSSSGVFTCWISWRTKKKSGIPNHKTTSDLNCNAWHVCSETKIDHGWTNLRSGFDQCPAFPDTTSLPLCHQNPPQLWSALYSGPCQWPSRHGRLWIQRHHPVKTLCMLAVEMCACLCVLLPFWPHSWVVLQELCQLLHTFSLYGAAQQGLCVGVDEEGWHGAQQRSNAKGAQTVVVRVTWEHTGGTGVDGWLSGLLYEIWGDPCWRHWEQISHAQRHARFFCIPEFH